MGTFYHRICEAQLIAFDRLFIGIDIVIIGVQLYFAADVFYPLRAIREFPATADCLDGNSY